MYDCQYLCNVPSYGYIDDSLKKNHISLFWGICFFFHSFAIVNIAAVNVIGRVPYFKYKEIQKELPLTIPVKESEEGN